MPESLPHIIFQSVTRSFISPHADKGLEPFSNEHPLSLSNVQKAAKVITALPGYAPTPLRLLDKAAEISGLGSIFYKDESHRFHLKNFKPLGGAYAVLKLKEKVGDDIVITSSTAGSHGRAIAWGAQMANLRCVIFIGEGVSMGREKGMTDLGAEVIRVQGRYEHSFQAAIEASQQDGWHLVCDTAFRGYEDIPFDIMQGYAVMVTEIRDQLSHDHGIQLDDLSHVFLQAGCGGFAAAIISAIVNQCKNRPKIILVEPESAACVMESLKAETPIYLEGDLSTIMGGLEVAEVSLVAWPILKRYCDAALAITDNAVAPMMRAMRAGILGGGLIEAGESAPAGLIAALSASQDKALSQALDLSEKSRVLVIGTEGAADPETYEQLSGFKPLSGTRR